MVKWIRVLSVIAVGALVCSGLEAHPSRAAEGSSSDWVRELNQCRHSLTRLREASDQAEPGKSGHLSPYEISRSVANSKITVSVFAGYKTGKPVFEDVSDQVLHVLVTENGSGRSHALTLPVKILDEVHRSFRYAMPDGSTLDVSVRNAQYPMVGFLESVALTGPVQKRLSWDSVQAYQDRKERALRFEYEGGLGSSAQYSFEGAKKALGYEGDLPKFLYMSIREYVDQKKAQKLAPDLAGEGASCMGPKKLGNAKDLERLRSLVDLTREAQARCKGADSWFDKPVSGEGRHIEMYLDSLRWLDRCLGRVEKTLKPGGAPASAAVPAAPAAK